jgi:AcrR family transcriptional regulator
MSTIRKADAMNLVYWKQFKPGETGRIIGEQENKERILMVAATLFANNGYAGTSTREIVEAASVTKPTLYYYFKNKEDLYIKLMDLALGAFACILDESLARTGAMRSRLVGLFTDIFELFRNHVDLLRLVNAMIYGPPGATPPYDFSSKSNHLERVLTGILDAGVAEGELRPDNLEEVMLLLMGLLRSIQVLLVIKPARRTLTCQDIAGAIDLIFDGTKASPRKQTKLTEQ